MQAIPRFAMDGLDSGTLTVKVDFVKGHVRLGLATIDSQPQKAADAFQQALRLDPSNEAYEKYLGEARANLEKYEKADANEMSVGEAQAQGIGYKMVQAWRTSPLGISPRSRRPASIGVTSRSRIASMRSVRPSA